MSAMGGPAEVSGAAPAWWSRELRIGQSVDLMIYGERMKGRLAAFGGQVVEVTIPVSEQTAAVRAGTAHGTVSISIDGGSISAPVTCWPVSHIVRLQIIGPVELVQRRQHERRDLDVMAALTWESEPGQWDRALSRTSDISIGGVQVRSVNVVWPSRGTAVWLTIDLPGGLPVHVEAQVAGKTLDYGLRLRFVHVTPDLLSRIQDYVDGA